MLDKFKVFLFENGLQDAIDRVAEMFPQVRPVVYDHYESQLQDYIRSADPSKSISTDQIAEEIDRQLDGSRLEDDGVWAFYPWSNRLVHLLNEEKFVKMRTDRNRNKITAEEQALLATKRVGVVGLSVGQSVSLSLAMERSFGELRIADFDTLELTNLNRIRAGVHDLGVMKTVVTAREVAEIDPYLEVKCFHDGLQASNIDDFILGDGKLDVIIDECDSLDVKILIRKKAKEHGIPVLMDTSDRGMLDVERFDLEPDRPIFHGLIEHLPTDKMAGLTNAEKIPYISALLEGDRMSERLRKSLGEVGKSISTWPQLATAVAAGGAHTAAVCRMILLNQTKKSGRYYIDAEDQLS